MQALELPQQAPVTTHKYVYVWVRKDIPQPYQIIQAGHALHEMGMDTERPREYDESDPTCPPMDYPVHIVLFGVKNEKELLEASRYLNENAIKHHTFYEPDFETGFTAIATELVSNTDEERRALFSKYRMY